MRELDLNQVAAVTGAGLGSELLGAGVGGAVAGGGFGATAGFVVGGPLAAGVVGLAGAGIGFIGGLVAYAFA